MVCGPAPLPQTSLRTVYPPLDQVAHLSEDDQVAASAAVAAISAAMVERTALCILRSFPGHFDNFTNHPEKAFSRTVKREILTCQSGSAPFRRLRRKSGRSAAAGFP